MKKLFVLLLSGLVLVFGSVSASAFGSPGVKDDSNSKLDSDGNAIDGNKNGKDGSDSDGKSDSDGNSNGSSDSSNGNSGSGSSSSTSPKTGSASTYAVLMAGAALAFGGVAVSAKKKISE